MDVFRLAVLGRTGKGKTYWIKNILLPVCPRPVWILDSEGDFDVGKHFRTVDALRNRVVKEMDPNDPARPHQSEIYVVDCDTDASAMAFLKLFARVRLPGVLVIDEVSKWCDARTIPQDLAALSKYGRKHGQSLITAAQRPTDIHGDLLSQTDAIISFQQTLKRDIKRLEQFGDVSALPRLKKTEYIALLDYKSLPISPAIFSEGLVESAH